MIGAVEMDVLIDGVDQAGSVLGEKRQDRVIALLQVFVRIEPAGQKPRVFLELQWTSGKVV